MLVPQKPAVRRWLNKIGQAQFCRLLAVHRGDTLGLAPALWPQRLAARQGVEDVLAQVRKEEACFSRKALAVNGRDIMALGVPQGTVKTRLMKARARLSVLLREDWEEGEQ